MELDLRIIRLQVADALGIDENDSLMRAIGAGERRDVGPQHLAEDHPGVAARPQQGGAGEHRHAVPQAQVGVGRAGGAPRTLFATHYHEMTELAVALPGVRNLRMAVRERGHEVVFTHRVEAGAADRSYGIHALLNAVCEDEATGAAAVRPPRHSGGTSISSAPTAGAEVKVSGAIRSE